MNDIPEQLIDLGNPLKLKGDGYAPWLRINSRISESIFSVVTPGATRDSPRFRAPLAILQELRIYNFKIEDWHFKIERRKNPQDHITEGKKTLNPLTF